MVGASARLGPLSRIRLTGSGAERKGLSIEIWGPGFRTPRFYLQKRKSNFLKFCAKKYLRTPPATEVVRALHGTLSLAGAISHYEPADGTREIPSKFWFTNWPDSSGFSGLVRDSFVNLPSMISVSYLEARERLANGILLPKSCGFPLVYAVRRNQN
jgi:hypothetical protein